MSQLGFGCDKCGLHFRTLESAVKHLRGAAHHADSLELMTQYGHDFRTEAACKLLFSFTKHDQSVHQLLVEESYSRSQPPSRQVSFNDDHEFRVPVKRTRVELPASQLNPPSRSQAAANSANVVTNVFMDPVNIRVHLTIDPGRPTDVFPFQFDRDSHDTVEKLLHSVENVFKDGHDGDVNVEELARRRLIMHMFKKGAATIGGNVKDDHDLAGIKGVRGTGWYGQIEIG